jgi:hypothetical protein
VQHGQAVRFENNDQVNHSIMGISLVKANQLNTAAGPGQPIIHTFEPQKGPVMIGCSLHPWMRGWVHVLRHPWFALTDDTGKFEIHNVPPGEYTLAFSLPDTDLSERRKVTVKAGGTLEVNIDVSQLKVRTP